MLRDIANAATRAKKRDGGFNSMVKVRGALHSKIKNRISNATKTVDVFPSSNVSTDMLNKATMDQLGMSDKEADDFLGEKVHTPPKKRAREEDGVKTDEEMTEIPTVVVGSTLSQALLHIMFNFKRNVVEGWYVGATGWKKRPCRPLWPIRAWRTTSSFSHPSGASVSSLAWRKAFATSARVTGCATR